MPTPFRTLLIANRGEIACRIIGTARRMGLRTVAVYSEADAGARHVRLADAAVLIGPAPARESYLSAERLLAAARDSGAEAIHPGYGFLSENAAFAEAVQAAGLVWVGPDPASIRAMGLKDAAKALMAKAGVPVTPGYHGADQSPERLAAEAAKVGYPVLIKAVAGGGGKGMRRVDQPDDFAEALASCQREASASFGNSAVLIEKWITSPRHIEVQVFGDRHGQVIHLGERDCSLQRRHQKVIEEAPAPGMDPITRAALGAVAVRAAAAVNYVGAGTVEFIADCSAGLRPEAIWFMEMNTRLQVEHPVTEAVTGLDLVEWQLRVAMGEALPLTQDQITLTGHAVEARLYAEDPAADFRPSTGPLTRFQLPTTGRIDTGVDVGDVVSAWYDPILAKLVCHAPTRDEALAGLAAMAEASSVWPVRTNAGFVAKALRDPDVVAGRLDTGLVARRGAAWVPGPVPSPEALAAVAAAIVAEHQATVTPPGPALAPGWRLNQPSQPVSVALASDGTRHDAAPGPAGAVALVRHGDGWLVHEAGETRLVTPWRPEPAGGASGSGTIHAPMPGLVTAVAVAEGDTVKRGQTLLTLEAMKMEQALVAPFDGVVAELLTAAGRQVAADALLARIVEPE